MAAMPVAALAFWSGVAVWLLAGALLLSILFALKGQRLAGTARSPGASVYHLISVAAMIYAMSLMDHGASAAAMPVHHHGATAPMAMSMGQAASAAGWIALALGILFLLDGLLTLGAGLFAPRFVMRATAAAAGSARIVADPPAFSRRAYFFAAFAHITMDLGMAWMLLG
jgi:hypothetical protein